MLEACRRSPKVKQIVYASSDKAYGESDVLPYTESTPLRGRYPYDVSKSCGDLIAQSYAASFGVPVAITRCGNFFGGGDLNWNRLVPGTIRSALRGERPVIRSDGTLVRDYFYVEDGAAAYMLLAESLAESPELRGEAFNFSNGQQADGEARWWSGYCGSWGESMEFDMRDDAPNEISHQSLRCGAGAHGARVGAAVLAGGWVDADDCVVCASSSRSRRHERAAVEGDVGEADGADELAAAHAARDCCSWRCRLARSWRWWGSARFRPSQPSWEARSAC